jgi:LEA14-like dessication related protein
MKNLRPILILGGLGVIGYALYRYYLKQIDFLKDITYQVVGLKVVAISANQVSMDITTRIFNASNVEATVKEMYLDFLINGIKVGSVNEVKDILILPSKSTDVTFNFKFNPRTVGQNLLDIVSLSVGAKDVVFDAKGFVKVQSSFITTTIPFEYSNNLKSLLNKK